MAKNYSYLVAAKRSPTGRFLGGLSKLSAAEIGAQVAKAMLADARVSPAAIDEVLIGMVLQAGAGQNPARQLALGAGLPNSISCSTINKVCGSGLQTVMSADQIIRAGDGDLILAGGIENMSLAPFLVREMRGGQKFGSTTLLDSLQYDGLVNIYDGDLMGDIGEETASKANVTRQQQDAFAARSHQRAAKAESEGFFNAERVPIEVRPGKPPITAEECIRADATVDALSILKPVFKNGRTVTAGNASSLADGAATLLVASEKAVKQHNLTPMARIVASVTFGMHPREVFFTPIGASRAVCEKAGWPIHDVDLWEINEAFAAEMCAVLAALELDPEKVNISGGGIALGHPLGASGARILVTLLHAMKRRKARKGVAGLCLGGGNAVAVAVEQV